MNKYFNVFLEFDHERLHSVVRETIDEQGKGYVCVVDANVITIAQKDIEYRTILNESTVNTCDGSSIAMLAGFIHKKNYQALNGPDIFAQYIEKPYKQILLGSTEKTLENIKLILESKGIKTENLFAIPLPFGAVEDFDYKDIANELNKIRPDIIWVSLGAPKQERFMQRILPFLDQGIMFGIGAAFNFYTGKLYIPRVQFGSLRFIWLSRLFREPKKLISRLLLYIFALPKMYISEKKVIQKNLL